jgi:hypothetical protein
MDYIDFVRADETINPGDIEGVQGPSKGEGTYSKVRNALAMVSFVNAAFRRARNKYPMPLSGQPKGFL